jgi:glutathione S-transferase
VTLITDRSAGLKRLGDVEEYRSVRAKLLAIPGSHPCAAAQAMLEAKRVPYTRVDLFPALSRLWLRATGFDAATVPALRLDGVRVQGTGAIARALDVVRPDPPLVPRDPAIRARVEEIEAWADGPLQTAARRIVLWSALRSPDAVRAALVGARLQFRFPARVAALPVVALPVIGLDAAINGAREPAVRAALAGLSAMLDRADEWMTRGDLGRSPPTVADYQVAGCVRLLVTVEDLGGMLGRRPVAALACRLIPAFPGRVPAGVLPRAWIE